MRFPHTVRLDQPSAEHGHALAMDVQPRVPEYGARWHHPNAETGACSL